MIRLIDDNDSIFALDTENTSYIFSVMESGHLEHLYYGSRIDVKNAEECDTFREKREFELGNLIAYSKEFPFELPEDVCYEISTGGHGDVREPFAEAVLSDGCRSLDFKYDSYEITDTLPESDTLPRSYGGGKCLRIVMKDGDLTLELFYCVFDGCDVITRSAAIINNGESAVELERLMSMQLDIPKSGFNVTTFRGAWVREMNRYTTPLHAGKLVCESRAGCSSNRANPFFMVHDAAADEEHGGVYGFNLIYSGNHYSAAEVNAFGKTRIVLGIQPQGFRYLLEAGESFEAPEAVMTYSDRGFSGQSANMHRFVREHIVRGKWKSKPRHVLLNSWEACYFNISEQTLLSLAKNAKELGIELLVMDDGWFGERDNDTSSLGDWEPSKKKLPKGLGSLSKKITAMGIKFGVWVEPEMISVNSRLYEKHPDWAMAIPDKLHSEGRNQRVLDLSNPEVVEYITNKMEQVLSSGDISYVKWDMNRIFSDVYSPYLPANRQGETAHRYICGLYKIMRTLTEEFPNVLFEGCASGGNRFDLGILCYFPQIWASDNTDAVSRLTIQEGYSFGYPQSTYTAHVAASPNHQTLRQTPLDTRFSAAAFALLGYECDVRDLSSEQRREITAQIDRYKKWRTVFQYGQLYRVRSGAVHEWCCVSHDKKRAAVLLANELTVPNTQFERVTPRGLDPKKRYRFYNIPTRVSVKQFGSLINTMAPVHVKQDSLVHNVIAKAVKMNGEEENVTATGEQLMNAGVSLKPAFSGTGLNDNVRVFPDFSARVYYIEEIVEEDER